MSVVVRGSAKDNAAARVVLPRPFFGLEDDAALRGLSPVIRHISIWAEIERGRKRAMQYTYVRGVGKRESAGWGK